MFGMVWPGRFSLVPSVREMPPGLLQLVLTVLVFWSWVLLLPRLPLWSRCLRLFPWASILPYGPLDTCLGLLPAAPLPPMQKRDAQHIFCSTGGHTPILTQLGAANWPPAMLFNFHFSTCCLAISSLFSS